MSSKKLPYAYELKRIVAQHWREIYLGDEVRGLATAPVYVFPNQERFESDEVTDSAKRLSEAGCLKSPELEFIFEIHRDVHTKNDVEVILIYSRWVENEACAFVYLFCRHQGQWQEVICKAQVKDGEYSFSHTPDNPIDDNEGVESALEWRIAKGFAILSSEPDVISETVSGVKRQLLKAKGVSGWEYKIVNIDTEKLKVRPRESVGTHASPRWHTRRGHWRRLASGARVFVRSCEVGDKSRGGVVKDYVVV